VPSLLKYGLFIGLISGLFTCTATQSPAQTPPPGKHQFNRDIRCVIQTERINWNRGNEAVISGEVENLTDGPLSMELDATFYLSASRAVEVGDKYWAPVDLQHDKPVSIEKHPVRSGRIMPVPIHLRFKNKGDKVEFRIDAQHLLWAEVVSSVWPSLPLFKTVKSDEYDLRLVLETDRGTAESPKVKISIDAGKTPKQ
jgi:hypothetical protein